MQALVRLIELLGDWLCGDEDDPRVTTDHRAPVLAGAPCREDRP